MATLLSEGSRGLLKNRNQNNMDRQILYTDRQKREAERLETKREKIRERGQVSGISDGREREIGGGGCVSQCFSVTKCRKLDIGFWNSGVLGEHAETVNRGVFRLIK